jgi:hypothetical protein
LSANDSQVGGSHYRTDHQTWDFIVANGLGYLEGNIIKYVVRHRKKHGVQDLKKAMHYLQKLIETEEQPSRSYEPKELRDII